MTSILPRDLDAGVHALEPLCPGVDPEHLRVMVEAVVDAVDPHEQCGSLSPFHGERCKHVADDHTTHLDRFGRTWVDGSSMLKGRYGRAS